MEDYESFYCGCHHCSDHYHFWHHYCDCELSDFRNDIVNTRIQEYVVSPSSTGWVYAETPTDVEQLQGSLFSRTVIPFLRKIAGFLGQFLSLASAEQLNWKLSIIRNPLKLRAFEFNGIRLLVLLGGIALAVLLNVRSGFQNRLDMVAGVGLLVVALLVPEVWLNAQVRRAQNEARAGLPDALDMLSVCAYAGLGFDQSLQRVSEYWHTTLGNEFKRVVNEIELGVSRADALRNMSNRLRIPELSTFVAVIIQADSLGMPTADVLRRDHAVLHELDPLSAQVRWNELLGCASASAASGNQGRRLARGARGWTSAGWLALRQLHHLAELARRFDDVGGNFARVEAAVERIAGLRQQLTE